MLHIDALAWMEPNILAAIQQLGREDRLHHHLDPEARVLVDERTEVLASPDEAAGDRLRGLTVLGAVPPEEARYVTMVAEPSFRRDANPDSPAEELVEAFLGLYCVRIALLARRPSRQRSS
jgi:hypothetical protein